MGRVEVTIGVCAAQGLFTALLRMFNISHPGFKPQRRVFNSTKIDAADFKTKAKKTYFADDLFKYYGQIQDRWIMPGHRFNPCPKPVRPKAIGAACSAALAEVRN